jgi:probable phosphoglycerate mutase
VTAHRSAAAPPDAIWLVRHAATAWTGRRWCGRADPPLTVDGHAAASALAAELARDVPSGALVVASPTRRARATAVPIALALGSAVDVLELLVEADVGRAEGLTWEELSTREPDVAAAIANGGPVDWPGGESATQLADRAAAAARELDERAGGRPLVVVSHGAFLHALAGALRAGSPARAGVPLEPAGVLRLDR